MASRHLAGLIVALLASSVAAAAATPASAATVGTIKEYPLPVETTPYSIAVGPDNRIWFADSGNHVGSVYVGHMALDGAIAAADLIALPNSNLHVDITAGPDGNVWTAQGPHMNRLAPTATQTSDVTVFDQTSGYDVVNGPLGRIWFTTPSQVGSMDPNGTVHGPYTVPTPGPFNNSVQGLTVGADGKLWVGEGSKIARMGTDGTFAPGDEWPLPDNGGNLESLTTGPDGNVWFTFTGAAGGAIGRITPAGVITYINTPTVGSLPFGIAAGPDGRMWFAERNGDRIGVLATTATATADITEFPIPGAANVGLLHLTGGPDGRVWFVEFNRNAIGAISTGADAAPPATTPPPTPAPAGTPSATPPPATPAAPAQVPLPSFAQVLSAPSTKRCASRRSFAIRLRLPANLQVTDAVVKVNGKRVKVLRGSRLRSPVDLRGLVKGRFTVDITVHTADGRTLHGVRRYRTCAAKRTHKHKRGL